MSDDFEISAESLNEAENQVDDAVTYFRFYHYLSRQNFHKELEITTDGAIVLPPSVLSCVGYGFARGGEVFCIHLTGILFSFFERFFPKQCVLLDDGNYQGIDMVLKPLDYGDYAMPPLRIFFPVVSPWVFNKLKKESVYLNMTKIDLSLIHKDHYEVLSVIEDCVKISTLDQLLSKTDYSQRLRNMV